jgi:hypothetical protein
MNVPVKFTHPLNVPLIVLKLAALAIFSVVKLVHPEKEVCILDMFGVNVNVVITVLEKEAAPIAVVLGCNVRLVIL